MSDLASTYALQIGVPLSKPTIYKTFFPLGCPMEKVVLIHGFGGALIQEQNGMTKATFPAKVFDHFSEVVALIKPALDAARFSLYQIGAPGEPGIKGCNHLMGQTTIHQCAYLVQNAALLIGNDSMWAHQRGAFDGALVAVYGPTSSWVHGPHWKNEEKTILIDSHRFGKKPSYQAQESPKTINAITPEQVANAALKLLGLPQVSQQSIFMGAAYNQPIVELVPDSVVAPGVNIPGSLVIRMDYLHNEKLLTQNLSLRPCNVIANREIDLAILGQLRQNISAMRLEIDKIGPGWIKEFKKLGIKTMFSCSEKDPEKVAAMRLEYFDACFFDQFVPPTLEDFKKDAEKYLNKPLDSALKLDTLSFKSNKFLLSDNKVFLSKAHWKAGKNTPNTSQNTGQVIDDPVFWEESAHFYLFKP